VDNTREERETNISDTGDTSSLEFSTVKLFYCGLKIRSSLELNKASDLLVIEVLSDNGRY
jgi:hypothetical protein